MIIPLGKKDFKMNMVYGFHPTMPYDLHDMTIGKIEIAGEHIRFYFDQGYRMGKENSPQVNGNILIEKVDLDFSYIHFLSDNGTYGNFHGKKLEIPRFIKNYKDFSLELIQETYGYHSMVYAGYLRLPKRKKIIDMTISLSYTGNIIYEIKD